MEEPCPFIFIVGFYFEWLIFWCNADDRKVFGGRLARKGEFPCVVAILESLICAGTIVKLDKIVTAAHCIVKPSGDHRPKDGFTIYGGSLKIPVPPEYKDGEGSQIRYISKVKVHDKYKNVKNESYFNDVAVIIVNKPFVLTATLALVNFPKENEKEFIDAWNKLATSEKTCIGVGWGTTVYVNRRGQSYPDRISEDLKAIDMTPIEQKKCRNYFKEKDKEMTKAEVCVSTKIGESICSGDSGSPLFCDGFAFALSRAVIDCGNKTRGQYFLLFGPYFDFFNRVVAFGSLLTTNSFIVSSTLMLHYYP